MYVPSSVRSSSATRKNMSSIKYHNMKKYGEWRNNSTAILAPVASSLELYIFPIKLPPKTTTQEAALTS